MRTGLRAVLPGVVRLLVSFPFSLAGLLRQKKPQRLFTRMTADTQVQARWLYRCAHAVLCGRRFHVCAVTRLMEFMCFPVLPLDRGWTNKCPRLRPFFRSWMTSVCLSPLPLSLTFMAVCRSCDAGMEAVLHVAPSRAPALFFSFFHRPRRLFSFLLCFRRRLPQSWGDAAAELWPRAGTTPRARCRRAWAVLCFLFFMGFLPVHVRCACFFRGGSGLPRLLVSTILCPPPSRTLCIAHLTLCVYFVLRFVPAMHTATDTRTHWPRHRLCAFEVVGGRWEWDPSVCCACGRTCGQLSKTPAERCAVVLVGCSHGPPLWHSTNTSPHSPTVVTPLALERRATVTAGCVRRAWTRQREGEHESSGPPCGSEALPCALLGSAEPPHEHCKRLVPRNRIIRYHPAARSVAPFCGPHPTSLCD